MVQLTLLIIVLYILICLYSCFVSFHSVIKSRSRLGQGHLGRLVSSIGFLFVFGFLYAVWNVVRSFGYTPGGTLGLVIENILLIAFLAAMTYLALAAKELSDMFGFEKR